MWTADRGRTDGADVGRTADGRKDGGRTEDGGRTAGGQTADGVRTDGGRRVDRWRTTDGRKASAGRTDGRWYNHGNRFVCCPAWRWSRPIDVASSYTNVTLGGGRLRTSFFLHGLSLATLPNYALLPKCT